MEHTVMKQPPAFAASVETAMAALEDVFGTDEVIEEIEEVKEPEAIEELDIAAAPTDLADLEEEVGKLEAYEGMTADGPDMTLDAAAELAAKVDETKAKKAKAPKAPRVAKPRVEKDLKSLPLEVFALKDGDPATEAHRDAVLATMPAQKKIAEKFENIFQSLAAGKLPSVYTVSVVKILADNPTKNFTVKELCKALEEATTLRGSVCGPSTSSSQVGQMNVLMPLLNIAVRDGKSLRINADSPLVKRLVALF
jgi:hypothetical protein